jgi:hypothetical protein
MNRTAAMTLCSGSTARTPAAATSRTPLGAAMFGAGRSTVPARGGMEDTLEDAQANFKVEFEKS